MYFCALPFQRGRSSRHNSIYSISGEKGESGAGGGRGAAWDAAEEQALQHQHLLGLPVQTARVRGVIKGYFGHPSAVARGVPVPREQGTVPGLAVALWRSRCCVSCRAARSCKHAAARARVGVLQRAGFTLAVYFAERGRREQIPSADSFNVPFYVAVCFRRWVAVFWGGSGGFILQQLAAGSLIAARGVLGSDTLASSSAAERLCFGSC